MGAACVGLPRVSGGLHLVAAIDIPGVASVVRRRYLAPVPQATATGRYRCSTKRRHPVFVFDSTTQWNPPSAAGQ